MHCFLALQYLHLVIYNLYRKLENMMILKRSKLKNQKAKEVKTIEQKYHKELAKLNRKLRSKHNSSDLGVGLL